ncbi:MAG: hypothetical protein GWN01_07490, partial [Nitrosopumilaceae archaeon]|nr:hypothetical protein [Nitrosopumilaceae archaeon]NIU87211.1 hypothetical protein [Nitrosopumilaceae archaeon]NIX61368.1 hypothetical protein [Nitrosopumilaceae archaeon]
MTEYKKSGFLRIPHALLDSIDTKRCGLFIGSGISINSGLPSWHNLILELMNSCIDYGISSKEQNELNHLLNQGAFLEVAADYSREKMGNRRFHDIMQKLFRSPNIETNEIHDLIINLNFPLIITTNYDKLLEKAFTYTYPGEVPPVYTYKNTASLARLLGESEFFILKIHGDIDDVGTIILTKKDYRKVLSENPACRVTLFNLFASYSFLFLGFSIKDPDLNLILEDLSVTFGGFARRHFALMQDPGDILSKSFSNNYNVEIMPYTSNIEHGKAVYNFLIELKKLIKNRPHKHKYETKSRKSITHPYKFLDFYDVDDSVIFFGREREVAEIIDLINARDITTLTGKSGVGKTSLVKAGLFPKFISNDYIPLYVRSSSNMISAFDSAFPRQTYDNIIDTPPMTKPTDLFTELKRLSDSDEIIIVLDQFEEFFIRLDKKARNPWIEVLSRLIHDESLLIKLIIVI